MIKDLMVSFKDNISTKSTNPFFGTLILVWITKNWNLIYSIFNFDTTTSLEVKRSFIIEHFTQQPFIETLLWCVLESYIILIISYALVNFARLIVNFFDKQITPFVYKLTDEKSIVLKSIYEISENERKRLEKRVEEEREAKLKLQEDYDKLEKRLAEILANKNSQETNDKDENQSKSSKQKNTNTDEEKTSLLLNKFQKENIIDAFEEIASAILTSNAIKKENEGVTKFTTLGLITPGSYSSPGIYYFNLTPTGKMLHEKILMEKLK